MYQAKRETPASNLVLPTYLPSYQPAALHYFQLAASSSFFDDDDSVLDRVPCNLLARQLQYSTCLPSFLHANYVFCRTVVVDAVSCWLAAPATPLSTLLLEKKKTSVYLLHILLLFTIVAVEPNDRSSGGAKRSDRIGGYTVELRSIQKDRIRSPNLTLTPTTMS